MTYTVEIELIGYGGAYLGRREFTVNASDEVEAAAKARRRARSEHMRVIRVWDVKEGGNG